MSCAISPSLAGFIVWDEYVPFQLTSENSLSSINFCQPSESAFIIFCCCASGSAARILESRLTASGLILPLATSSLAGTSISLPVEKSTSFNASLPPIPARSEIASSSWVAALLIRFLLNSFSAASMSPSRPFGARVVPKLALVSFLSAVSFSPFSFTSLSNGLSALKSILR